MVQILTFSSIAFFVIALIVLAVLDRYLASKPSNETERVLKTDRRQSNDIHVRKRHCPRCRKKTVQITEIALDDDPGFGQIWKCAECSARLEFIPPFNL